MGANFIKMADIGSSVLGGGLKAGGMLSEGFGSQQQGAFQSNILKNNAYIANEAARAALASGKMAEQQKYIEGAQTIGSQRAGFAAHGVVVDRNSADVLASDVKRITTQDAQQIKANAERQALAYKLQGYNYTLEAKQAKREGMQALMAGLMGAGGTLLTSASSVAAKWKYYQNQENDTTTAGL